MVESYESMKHVIRKILKDDSDEFHIFIAIFEEIDFAIRKDRFTETFKLPELMEIHARVVELISFLLTRPAEKHKQKVTLTCDLLTIA